MEISEDKLRNEIKTMIRESVFDEVVDFEEAKKKSHKKQGHDARKHKHHRSKLDSYEYSKSKEENGDDSEKVSSNDKHMSKIRSVVRGELANDKTDEAQYYYELWPEKDPEAARSYGYKCRKGEKNDSGSYYDFDTNEYNELYKMLNNNH